MAHGERYASEFGWNTEFEGLVARIVADFAEGHDPERESGWIAELDGRRIGCVFLLARRPQTAQLRTLLVDPVARGRGVGAELVNRCLEFARQAGYREVVLWTNDVLAAAQRIYLAAGFELTSEEAHRSFGADLVGQNYRLALRSPAGG